MNCMQIEMKEKIVCRLKVRRNCLQMEMRIKNVCAASKVKEKIVLIEKKKKLGSA